MTDFFQVDGDGRLEAENLQLVASSVSQFSGEIDNYTVDSFMSLGSNWRGYSLDNRGNWLAKATAAGEMLFSPDNMSRLTSATGVYQPGSRLGPQWQTVAIDQQDNLNGLPQDSAFTFDAFTGVLQSATTPDGAEYQYLYDANDRRVGEIGPDGVTVTDFVWAGAKIVAHGISGDLTIDVPGTDVDSHLASIDTNGTGTAYFYHQSTDQSVLAISGNSGLIEGYSYSAYGETRFWASDGSSRDASLVGNRFLFQGQLYDAATATYSMRAREYRPGWGSFLSPDPLSVSAGPSPYAFVGGRPLSMRDPSGLSGDDDDDDDDGGGYTDEDVMDGPQIAMNDLRPDYGPKIPTDGISPGQPTGSTPGTACSQPGGLCVPGTVPNPPAPPSPGSGAPSAPPDNAPPSVAPTMSPNSDPRGCCGAPSAAPPTTFGPMTELDYATIEYNHRHSHPTLDAIGDALSKVGFKKEYLDAMAVIPIVGAGGLIGKGLVGAEEAVASGELAEEAVQAEVVEGAASRILGFTERALQKGFGKHGADFGMNGNWNPAKAAEFSAAINKFVNSPGVQAIAGTYRGNAVTHFLNASTGLNVIVGPAGNYVSGWLLGSEQLQSVLSAGRLF
jgi:RHS repeat-associated protein